MCHMATCRFLHFVKLYLLPTYPNEFLQVQPVDTPVVELQSYGQLSKDGQGAVRYSGQESKDGLKVSPWSHHHGHQGIDHCLHFNRAAIVWMQTNYSVLPSGEWQTSKGANRVLKANAFSEDATLDVLTFSSRAMGSVAVTWHVLWPRVWQADVYSKNTVLAYALWKIDCLVEILFETHGEKKAMPKTQIEDLLMSILFIHSVPCPSSFRTLRTLTQQRLFLQRLLYFYIQLAILLQIRQTWEKQPSPWRHDLVHIQVDGRLGHFQEA